MARTVPGVVALILLIGALPAKSQLPGDPPRERLGARVGFTGTEAGLNETYGHGYDFTLYFTEKLIKTFYLDIRIGATYFGDSLKPEIGEALTRIPGILNEMRIAYLSVGPLYAWPVDETKTWYAAAGAGIYSITFLHDTGVQAFDYGDQSPGVNGGGGFVWRITTNWNIEANATVTYIWTDENDYYYYYTQRSANPLLAQLSLGISLDLR